MGPCSNTGSLKRHPECKYRLFECDKRIKELSALCETQRRLLRLANELMRPDGGSLVYCTCSLLVEENEEQVVWAGEALGLQSMYVPFTGCYPPVDGGRDGFF